MKTYSLNEARQLAINCVQQYEENYQHLTGLELLNKKGEVIKKQSRL